MIDAKTNLVYEGKDKKIWDSTVDGHLILEYKDLTIADGKSGVINNKGIYINKITNHLFSHLENNGIDTHLVAELSDRETVVRKVDMIPLEIIVRNFVAGTLVERTGLPEGTKLNNTVIEYYYKRPGAQSTMVNQYHAFALEICTPNEFDTIDYNVFRINKILSLHLAMQNIDLIDFKLEFGRVNKRIVLADEISPDTCRFWDSQTGEKLDKDRFRENLGNVEEAYIEICNRLLRA